MLKQKNSYNILKKIIKVMFFITMILGIGFTLTYIFYTSTALLTSDSVITDVNVHLQIMDKQFLLTNWYYGNEFWLLALNIPTLILSFIIKNSLLLRKISVLITAIIFFFLLYKYGKKFLNKKQTILFIIIFLTGISYSILDYFYAFNAYLTVVINSMVVLYLFYLVVFEKSKNKLLNIGLFVYVFLVNVGSIRYFPSVIIPLILTELIMLGIENSDIKLKKFVIKNKEIMFNLLKVLIVAIVSIGIFFVLTKVYHYEQRAGTATISELTGEVVLTDIASIVKCINNFFGYDNSNHVLTFLTGEQYFVNNHRTYPLISFFTFTNIIKIFACFLFIIVTPIFLFRKYKENDKKINFLLIFNTLSWAIMIFVYIFTFCFFYNNSELKYFIFNIVINICLSLYCIYKYFCKTNIKTLMFDIFILLYIISNLYTTFLTIRDNGSKVMKEKYELVNLLKKNNLTFGYGGFWNGLLTYFLSDYKITVASIQFTAGIQRYNWDSDVRWYNTHNANVFLIVDEKDYKYYKKYKDDYDKPIKILKCKGFRIYVYDGDPFVFNYKRRLL